MSLRKRIEKSPTLAWVFGLFAGSYLAICIRTTRWDTKGLDDLAGDLAKGPVLLVMWHSRCLMAGSHWPKHLGNLSTLHTRSPIARVIGAVHKRLGLKPAEMSNRSSNRVVSRMVLTRVKEGISIGMTVDGPTGPARKVKDAPLDWARATGMPIYSYAFSTSRGRHLNTWDRMLWPYPFGRGAVVFRRFTKTATRKMAPEALETLRADLATLISETTAEADAMVRRQPGP